MFDQASVYSFPEGGIVWCAIQARVLSKIEGACLTWGPCLSCQSTLCGSDGRGAGRMEYRVAGDARALGEESLRLKQRVGRLVCDVGTFRSLRLISSTWSFRCVKCITVCYSTRFPWGDLRCMDMLGCDAHEDIVIGGLEIITVRLSESSDTITE